LESEADRYGEGVHDSREGGALLCHPHEDLAGATVVVLTDGDVTLAVGHPELEGERPALLGHPLPDGLAHHEHVGVEGLLHLGQLRIGGPGAGSHHTGLAYRGGRRLLLGGRQGLAQLAVVAVDGHGLEAETPRLHVGLFDVVDRALLGQIDGLRNCS